MLSRSGVVFTLVLTAGLGRVADAQETRSSEASGTDPRPGSLVTRMVDRFLAGGGDEHDVPRFTIAFGGIKPGSGIALGPAVAYTFRDRSYVQLTAEYSIRNFKLLQVRYGSRRLLGDRLSFGARARWQDAPELSMFDMGPHSRLARALYGERRGELSGSMDLRLRQRWLVTAGAGVERYRTTSGKIDTEEDEALTSVPPLAGLGTRTTFVHTFAGGAYDTRDSPEYARRGWAAQAAVHAYHDATTGAFSFTRTELFGDAVLPNVGRRGTLDLTGHLWTSAPSGGSAVPFFLMPYLGSGSYMRGYRLYRFRDRDAALLSAEYRWPIGERVDALGFIDVGTVERTLSRFGGAPLHRDAGGGLVLHSTKATVARLQVAHGREGFQVAITFSSPASGLF